MRALAAVIIAALALMWVRQLTSPSMPAAAATALALGFTLIGAWVAGDVLRRLNLPRITGYLVFGVLVGPFLGNVISEDMAGHLQFVSGLATTLIALIAGLTLSIERLGSQLAAIAKLTTVILAVTMAGIAAGLWVIWAWLPILPEASGALKFTIIMLLSVVAVSFSPTMTAAVMTDTGARGRFGEIVLAVVVLADLAILVLFSLAMEVGRTLIGRDIDTDVNILVRLAWEMGGALAFGVLIGAVFALYLRYVGRQLTVAIFVVCAILTQVGTTQQFEPLLAAVAAGLVIENLAVAQGDALKTAVQQAAAPILVVFFVAVGTSLRVDTLPLVGVAAIGLATLRFALIQLGVRLGARTLPLPAEVGRWMWTGLISQAGITLGFASLIAVEFGGWGARVQTLLVAMVAIHELTGPLLFRRGLERAGAVGPSGPRPLIVVSNREPYLHTLTGGHIKTKATTGGVAVALDALMRERGGVWVAHAAGDADHLVVDSANMVQVPPDDPTYALRRLWLEEPAFSAYYKGFANEGLWPLCHVVDVRPKFRAEDWAAYQMVNERFAEAVDEQLASSATPVFIQDYHLALVASSLRVRRPSARTALFWHIPWPHPDRLRICPWRRELLEGLLANDLLAFQLERDRDNFMLAAEEELGAEVEIESSRIRHANHVSTVVSVPIGVDFDRIQEFASDPALDRERLRLVDELDLRAEIIGIGVDRLDYTKGIPERLAALDDVLTRRPELRGRLTFIQVGVPSRSEVDGYAALEHEVARMIDDLNARHTIPGLPSPVRYHTSAMTTRTLVALYRLAQFCVVSSLHDGMNLVAKEFVAARDDDDGVLVLSALAGAAQELRDALIINPYDISGFAAAIETAIDMTPAERHARMRSMRRVVAGRNVFSWASDILEGLESLWSKPLHYSVGRWEETAV